MKPQEEDFNLVENYKIKTTLGCWALQKKIKKGNQDEEK